MRRLAVFVLKSGLKQFDLFKDCDHAYLDGERLFPRVDPAEYDEAVVVDSTSASGLTLLKAKSLLQKLGFKNVKTAAHPVTKHSRAVVDIALPRREPVGTSVFVAGPAGSGKSALAYGIAAALGGRYVKWGEEVAKRFWVGRYGEVLASLESENPFYVAERLVLDGVFNARDEVLVVDGVKSLSQAVFVSYTTLRPALVLYAEVDPEVREFIVSVRGMPDDGFDRERAGLFSRGLAELREAGVVVRLDSKRPDPLVAQVFKLLGLSPTVKGYFNPFITKRVLLWSWYKAWVKARSVESPLVEEWASRVELYRGYSKRLAKRGAALDGAAADLVDSVATATRLIDDILDEHEVRLYSEEGAAKPARWTERGIYLTVVDSVALMLRARRIARRLGRERELFEAMERVVRAVDLELELEETRRRPRPVDWLLAAEREAAFREFAYSLAGLDAEAGYVEGVVAQAKDDLIGAEKGGREDTEERLNRPTLPRVFNRPEEVF
ncbi:hypothetical protein, partial [Thermogladius sp.]|uniref:hypothetical protein n=1 Tax=Thermogladius sp. TaxID=2023064 RepID=UPI003D0B2C76